MKECNKCNETKALTEFYKHKGMADGHLNKCKECTKERVFKHREKNLESIRMYDRKRGQLQHRKDKVKAYFKTEAGKKASDKARKSYRERNPVKYKAHNAVNNAIRDGVLVKMQCEVCEIKPAQAHHDDYDKPLNVRWLCHHHHKEWHAENGEGLNG